MNNLLTTKNQIILLISLILMTTISTCNSCSSKSESKLVKKEIQSLRKQVDSLSNVSISDKELRIEGLKTEKRMIQSTDRTILDVNRQSAIDNEIEALQK
jgi:hypothetical protein